MIYHAHTSLLGSEPGPIPAMSARARWLAGDDLDFPDSGSEESTSEEDVLDIEARGELSVPGRSRWSSGSSSIRPTERTSSETASLQIPRASVGGSQSDDDTASSEVQELEVPASAASDSTYSGTDEFFDISARAGVAAAQSRVLAGQRFTRDQPPAIHISPAFPPSPPPPLPQLNNSPSLSASFFTSPTWARARSHTEPGATAPRRPPRVRGLPSSPAPMKQVHFLQPTIPPRTALAAEYRERISRPTIFAPRMRAGFESPNRHDRRRTTSYSFI